MIELPFKEEIILENDKVLLRPLKKEDLTHLLSFAVHEPTLWQYSLMDASSEENMKQYIENAITKREARDAYPFIVFDKVSNAYAGSTRFYAYQKAHSTITIGYTWYGSEFQGGHVNKNCKYLMLQYAFDELGIERVEFRADNNNKRSIAAMKSIGCIYEGVLRSNCAAHNSERRDSIILSILKREWEGGIKSTLKSKID